MDFEEWEQNEATKRKRKSSKKKTRTNLIHITTVFLRTCNSRLGPCVCVCCCWSDLCVCDCICRLNESPFSTHTLIQFLMLSAKNHGSFVPSPFSHVCSPLCHRIATTMNTHRASITKNTHTHTWKWNGKIGEFHNSASNKTTTRKRKRRVRIKKETHPSRTCDMCARKTLVLFIFWCYFLSLCFFFVPNSLLKIRFVFHLVSR